MNSKDPFFDTFKSITTTNVTKKFKFKKQEHASNSRNNESETSDSKVTITNQCLKSSSSFSFGDKKMPSNVIGSTEFSRNHGKAPEETKSQKETKMCNKKPNLSNLKSSLPNNTSTIDHLFNKIKSGSYGGSHDSKVSQMEYSNSRFNDISNKVPSECTNSKIHQELPNSDNFKKKFEFKKVNTSNFSNNDILNDQKLDMTIESVKNKHSCEKDKGKEKFKFKRPEFPSTNVEEELSNKPNMNNYHIAGCSEDKNITKNSVISESDYMDDEEFERMFGSADVEKNKTPNTSSITSDYLADDINLEDIDWDNDLPVMKDNDKSDYSDLLEGVNLEDFEDGNASSAGQFSNRVDNSKEFCGDYPHSRVMEEVLHSRFGLRCFRPHQREICNASLTGHDIFVLMPTGGGKSLCYQLPATLTPGVTIVVSPLRSLISDQVDKLNALDIPAAQLCADQTKQETDIILSKLYTKEPEIKILFLTPEKISASRLCSDVLVHLYARDKLARFVIDEAHCLSQWGHDFRPDYKSLSLLRSKFPKVAIICLTATATKQVEGDVINILKLRNVKTFIRSFNRPNIKYKVIQKEKANVVDQITDLIKRKFFKQSGIVYCLSRDDCEKVADQLKRSGIQAMPYHAGMNSKVRDTIQRQWMQDRFHVIVGTIAFGMGIDKPDVRFVIHNSIPKSVEAFYQESGRAGRDGEVSYSFLYYGYFDVKRLQKIMTMEKSNKKSIEGHFEALKTMVSYCENHVDCRRYLQLIHLGETFDRQVCIKNKETTCDNCEQMKTHTQVDMTIHAKNLCRLVKDFTDKRDKITLPQISEVYKGSKARKIIEKGHDKHPHYAKGASMDKVDIQRILKQLILKDVLNEHCEYAAGFPVVYIRPGKAFPQHLLDGFKIHLTVNKSTPAVSAANKKDEKSVTPRTNTTTSTVTVSSPSVSTKEVSTSLSLSKQELSSIRVKCHEDLLEECRRLALERNMTLSSIMNLSAIKKMSDVLPKTKEEMLKIQHVTVANYEKYGEFFLNITKKYAEELDAKKLLLEKSKPPQKLPNLDDDGDWWYDTSLPSTSSSQGVKRKSYGGYKKATKKFKRNNWKSKGGGSKSKSGKSKGTPKKKAPSKNLGLMPVLHIS